MKITYSSLITIFIYIIYPLASSAQEVNLFDGSLYYNQSLLTIPNTSGLHIPISASYNSKINVNSPSSEIGLGWALNVGGYIARNVKGIPDDWKSKNVSRADTIGFKKHTGSLYFSNGLKLDEVSDIYKYNYYKIDSLNFYSVDYDDYFISFGNVNSKLLLSSFDFNSISETDENNIYSSLAFNKKPQFHIQHDYSEIINSRYYEWTNLPINNNTPILLPFEQVNGSTKAYNGDAYNDEDYSETYNKNRLKTGRYIEYFTNDEIKNHFNNVSIISGTLLDYTLSHNNRNSFDADGIGGYRVTDINGYTYHFMLPVYTNSIISGNYILNYDNSTPSVFSDDENLCVKNTSDDNYQITHERYPNNLLEYKQSEKYAYQWLLTAITGLDYEDLNNNGYADDGDKGLWVRFDYEKWSDGFQFRYPYYGADVSYSHTPESPTWESPIDSSGKIMGKYLTFESKNNELYYLNKVVTPSNTCVFIRDFRYDECSSVIKDSEIVFSENEGMVYANPQLKLSRIILFNNADFNSISNNQLFTPGTIPNPEQWNLSTVNNNGAFFHSNWYVQNKNVIDLLSLKSIEFVQNYNLAKGYYGNVKTSINNNFPPNNSLKITKQSEIQNYISNSSYSNSGKLTLNKIRFYENRGVQISPTVDFEYNSGTKNPDFNPTKVDYWGFYKSDATSNALSLYTTTTSSSLVDAWCLKKITQPIGSVATITYESNEYEKVINGKSDGTYKGASRTYLIENAQPEIGKDKTGKSWELIMEDAVNDLIFLLNTPPTGTIRKTYIPFRSYGDNCTNYYDWYFVSSPGVFSTNPLKVEVDSLHDYKGYLLDPNPCFVFNDFECVENDIPYIGNGYITFTLPISEKVYGGGARVSNIYFTNKTNEDYRIKYSYIEGVANREMDRFQNPYKQRMPNTTLNYRTLSSFSTFKYENTFMVGYSKVIKENYGVNNTPNGKEIYYFKTDDKDIDNLKFSVAKKERNDSEIGITYYSDSSFIIQVSDKFSDYWGQLISKEVLDINNNTLSKIIFEYDIPNKGALIEKNHIFHDYNIRSCGGGQTCIDRHHNVSIYTKHPIKLKKQIAYKNSDKQSTEYLNFDPILGSPTTISNTNTIGNISKSLQKFSYTISAYSTMGSKSVSFQNSNQLNLLSENTIIVNDNMIGQSNDFSSKQVSTYTNSYYTRKLNVQSQLYENIIINNSNYFISKSNYIWQGPIGDYGHYKNSSFSPFNFSNLSSNSNYWELKNDITLLDEKGHVIETTNKFNRYSSQKTGYENSMIITEALNSNYESFTSCGFEDAFEVDNGSINKIWFGGELFFYNGDCLVKQNDINRKSHTGHYYLEVLPNNIGSIYETTCEISGGNDLKLMRNRRYKTSIWVHEDSPNNSELIVDINNQQQLSANLNSAGTVSVGEWYLLSIEFDIPSNFSTGDYLKIYFKNNSTSLSAYIDDFRFQPIEATVKSYVYDKKTKELISVLNNDNFATINEYDEAGRIVKTFYEFENDQLRNVNYNIYHFARPID